MKQGWEIKKLGDIAYIGLGFTHTPEYVEKGVAFLSVKDISGGEICWDNIKYVSQKEYDAAPKGAKPNKGDILFCRVGTMGKPVIVDTDIPFCTFVSLGYLHIINNTINTYVKYWMQSDAFDIQVKANVKGVAIKNLNTGWLKEFTIPIPPLSEQEKIVAELDCLSGVIEKKKQQLKELDALAESIFYTMFGDPITNEKGWEVKPLKDVAEIIGGSTPKTNIEEYWNGNNYWATPAELHGARYIESTERCITNEAVQKTHLTLLPIGTVLLSSRAPIGKVCITRVPMYCNQGFKNVVCSDKLHPEYVYQYLFGKTEYLNSLGTGATFKEISKATTEKITIPIPPLTLQQEFASKIEAIEKQKELIKESIKETEELFNSRMDYYFN